MKKLFLLVLFGLMVFSAKTIFADDQDQLLQQLANTQAKMSTVQNQIQNNAAQQEQLLDQYNTTAQQVSRLNQSITNRQKQLDKQARSAQIYGESSNYLTMLVSSHSLSDFADRFVAASSIIKANNDLLERQRTDQKRLKELENNTQKTISDLAAKQSDIQRQSQSLSGMITDLQNQISTAKESGVSEEAIATTLAASKTKTTNKEDKTKKTVETSSSNGAATSDTSSSVTTSMTSVDQTISAAEQVVQSAQSAPVTVSTSGKTTGVLTASKGVNYFNGTKETYYSQAVLPGTSLNIPGRHVASDGTVRDADDYIVVASSQAQGTTGVSSLGKYKVYDSGTAVTGNHIDIYTNW